MAVKQHPRYVDVDKCIACGECAERCPAKVDSEFEEGLTKRKAAYLPYPQAVPLKYVIDDKRCIYFKKGKCRACEKYCPTGAILLDDKEKNLNLQVGSIIFTSGMDTFDPHGLDSYKYSQFPNVITSIEFERILSSSGPTSGEVLRLSDGKPAKKIAWLQCVGSRDINRCDNGYCSAVCCMYAIKESVMAKEHIGEDYEGSIFYIDIRTSGKDFEKYYNQAQEEGINFIRSRVHSITEDEETGTLNLIYATEDSQRIEEQYDLVVLSVGMEPSKAAKETAQILDLKLNEYNFVETSDFTPVSTSKPGIYVAGVIQGCKDIPQSIMEASAASCDAGIDLCPSRGTMITEKTFPPEKDVSGQEPRVGVFVCNCGTNIGGVADVPSIVEYSKKLPNVVYSEENQFTCSEDTQALIAETIKNENLNRVVVAACTPRTHEPLFQETIRSTGLNPYLFEMANIRNQCTWCHSKEKEKATEKAKDMVKMAVSRVNNLESIPELSVEIEKTALVVGGGISGMTAALSLADQGFNTTLVERDSELGGVARDIAKTWSGQDVQAYLGQMKDRIQANQNIDVLLNSEITDSTGYVGNFETDIKTNGQTKTVRHGVVIFATGGQAADSQEYLYGKSDRVTKWHEIENKPDQIKKAESIAFIQCVGSRDENRPYCSRICCACSINQAITIKEQDPQKNVYIIYRDIRTPGAKEKLYQKARRLGVIFIRYDLDHKPRVEENKDGLKITVFEPTLQQDLEIKADLLNLATAIVPTENEKLNHLFKLPVNEENFLMEAHVKLRPVDMPTDGLFLCGLAHYPKAVEESISQAKAAAGRAATILAKPRVGISPLISQIDQEKCIGCGLCIEVCPFGAIKLEEVEDNVYRAQNISASCKGCGICASTCPQHAIDMLHFRDKQIEAAISAAVGTE